MQVHVPDIPQNAFENDHQAYTTKTDKKGKYASTGLTIYHWIKSNRSKVYIIYYI